MSERVILREIGLRDGLQLIRGDLPTDCKIEWIRLAAAAGVQEIEVTSFVPAKTFPIFADAAVIAEAARGLPGLLPSALAVNLRGAELALDAGISKLSYVVSASEAHSKANVRRTCQEAVDAFAGIVASRAERGMTDRVSLSCGVATAFGCTLQGHVDPEFVLALAEQLADLGATEIMLADTVGYANPAQVERLFSACIERLPEISVSGHFHDTRGLGLANVAAAARVGVRRFDGSLGGLGGCPYAPGATGNVNFEDMVFMFEAMGYATGIDLDALLALRNRLPGWLPGELMTGAIVRAGVPKS